MDVSSDSKSDTLSEEVKSLSVDSLRENSGVISKEDNTRRFIFESNRKDFFNNNDTDVQAVINFKSESLKALLKSAKDDDKVIERRKIQLKKGSRENVVFNEAVRYGAQAALRSSIESFTDIVSKRKTELNAIYNFNNLMLYEGKVIPPVISLSENYYELSDREMRRVSTRYIIRKQAEFARRAPHAISYFSFSDYPIKAPSKFSIPLTENEKTHWSSGAYQGWLAGLDQAKRVIDESISELNRDYLGMVRFHAMLKYNMINLPELERKDIDFSSDGSVADVGEVVFRIRNLPDFNSDISNWRAIPKIDKLELEKMKFYKDYERGEK